MTMYGPFPLFAVCAITFLVLGGCGADEADGIGVRPSATPNLSPTATTVSVQAPTRTVPPTLSPSPTIPPPTATATALPTPSPTAIAAPNATPSPMPMETPAPTQEIESHGPMVLIGDARFAVELARTQEERNKGLSGRESLANSTGLLFVFEPAIAGAFWMRDMKFPLDFIWIGRGCGVVGLTLNAPAPEPSTPVTELPIYEIDEVASYTLEVNAGEVDAYDIQVGDEVEFSDVEVEGGGC